MGKSLCLDASSGIAGDMFVAALLDLGADREKLEKALSSIPAGGFEIKISRRQKSGIDCCDFNVILDKEHENHDHDMAYLYGPAPEAEEKLVEEHHCHCHEENGEHHCHCHEGGAMQHHHHEHRYLADVEAVIDGTDMSESARALAKKIFRLVAEAESKAHHLPIEEVHFHEVGAIDSIVDIIGAAVCFESLGVTEVIVPGLTEGRGTVRCQHGVLPVPVPATLNIITAQEMPLSIMDAKGEYVTPTGAAIACALATSHHLPPSFRVLKTGLGAGKREYKDRTNILRALLIETDGGAEGRDVVVKLESDIDDASGEVLGYAMDRIMKAGALDVHYSPIYMKKNRPAWELTVICREDRKEEMEKIIFQETTTIGIRESSPLMRSVLHREMKEVTTPYGKVKVKEVALGGEKRRYPEYESVKERAEKEGVPFLTVFDEAKRKELRK